MSLNHPKERTIDYALRNTWQAVARMYNEEAAKYEATMSQGFALLSIDKEDGTPSTYISSRMGMEPTSLTRTLKTLEEKGYIVRKKNPDDGRGVLIYLTEAGRQKRELSKATVLKFNEVLEAHIPAAQLDVFRAVTDQISQLIQEKNIF